MGKKVCIPLVLALWMIPLYAAAQGVKPYVSKLGYQLTPPAGWHVDTSGRNGLDVVLFAPTVNGYTPDIAVKQTVKKSDIPLAQVGPTFVQVFSGRFPDYRLVSQHLTTIDGRQALETVGTYVQAKTGVPMRLDQCMARTATHTYYFTMVAPEAISGRYETAMANVLRSVKLTE